MRRRTVRGLPLSSQDLGVQVEFHRLELRGESACRERVSHQVLGGGEYVLSGDLTGLGQEDEGGGEGQKLGLFLPPLDTVKDANRIIGDLFPIGAVQPIAVHHKAAVVQCVISLVAGLGPLPNPPGE